MPSGGVRDRGSGDNGSLHKREEKYRLMNTELEAKTARLLKEADDVLQNIHSLQNMTDSAHGDSAGLQIHQSEPTCIGGAEQPQDILVPHMVAVEPVTEPNPEDNPALDDVLPEPATKLSLGAQNRYLKAKVRVLQEEVQKMSAEMSTFHDESLQLRKRVRELEDERARLNRTSSNHSVQADKMKKNLEETRQYRDTLEVEKNALKKDNESIKRTANQQASELKSAQSRLHKSMEEVERLRTELDRARLSARDSSESMRQRIDQLTGDNRRLERQKTELISAFKKQLRLIDVLRRQKMLLEASKCLQLTEEDFLKALDWQPS